NASMLAWQPARYHLAVRPEVAISALVHEAAARGAYRFVLASGRRWRSLQRAAYAEYRAGLRFRARSQAWSHDQRMNWQLAELRRAVRSAYEPTRFYRERLDSIGFDPRSDFSFESYAPLPVVEREEMREAGEAMLSDCVPRALLREDATGGSTGTPTR